MSVRVFVLSNDDLTSNVIFAPLFESTEIEVVGLAFTSTILAKKRGGQAIHAFHLLRRTDRRYWLFQVFVNGAFRLREALRRRGNPRFPSLRAICRSRGIPVTTTSDFSSPEFVAELAATRPDLIVIRINQFLREEVLTVPPHGVWCVHSSILPSYGGIAAELHGLAAGETAVGTTVFRVTAQLDAGEPLVQQMIEVAPAASLFAAVLANNRAAARLLLRAVETLGRDGAVKVELVHPPPPPSYRSWPTHDDVRRFRARGRALIRGREALGYLRALAA